VKKAIELIRVSTKSQAEGHRLSVPAQRAANRRTAEVYGLEIVETIELIGVSGAAVLRAPEMQRLMQLIKNPEIAGVVVREFSRVARPECFGDFALFHAFQQSGTVLFLPEGPIDLGTKLGRLNVSICAAFAGLERTEAAERSWDAKEEMRKAGKHPSGNQHLPIGVGYDRVRSKWFYTAEAKIIRRIFDLVLAGELHFGMGHNRLRYVLRNPIYCGWRVIDQRNDPIPSSLKTRKDGRSGRRPCINRAPADILRIKVIERPLVSEIDFNRVQQLLDIATQRYYKTRRKVRNCFAFRAFLMCGRCGGRVYGVASRPPLYVCKNRYLKLGCDALYRKSSLVDEKVEELFCRQIASQGFVRKIAGMAKTANRRSHTAVDGLRSELRSLEQKRQRVLDLCVEQVISSSQRDIHLRAIQRETQRCTAMLLREPAALSISVKELTRGLSPFDTWPSLNLKQKRQMLASLATTIYVDNYKVVGISILADAPRIEARHSATVSLQLAPFRPELWQELLYVPFPA
jgi:DNA invertase Pin-like site-specific DNA recombinase